MNFIIIGDKFQKRMKSKGCVGLIKINHNSIIQHQFKIIKTAFPQAQIIYIYGFEGKKLLSFIYKNEPLKNNIVTIQNKRYEEYNSAYSLYVAKEFLNDDCFIAFGDNVLHPKMFNGFDTKDGSQLIINNKSKNRLGCVLYNNKIENIAYDLENYLSEVYFLSKQDSSVLKKMIENENIHNYFVFELINRLIDYDINIKPFFAEYRLPTLNKV